MHKNRIIAFLVSLLLVLSIFPTAVLAETHQILLTQEPTFDNFSEKVGQNLFEIAPKLTAINDENISISAAPKFEKFDGTDWAAVNMNGTLTPGTWRMATSVFYLNDSENHNGLSMESEVIVNDVKWTNTNFSLSESSVYGKVPILYIVSPSFEVASKAGEASYIVKVKKEYLNHTLDDVYAKMGKIGEMSDVTCEELEGLACKVENKEIKADGSTVVELNYTYKHYNLTWDLDGGETITDYKNGPVPYGYRVDLDYPVNPHKDGYEFVGWSEYLTTMPAHDVTIKAIFKHINLIERVDLHFIQDMDRLKEKAGNPVFAPRFEVISPEIVEVHNHMNLFYYLDPVKNVYSRYDGDTFVPGTYSLGIYLRVEGEESRLNHFGKKVELYVDGEDWGELTTVEYNYEGLYQFGWGSSEDFEMKAPKSGVNKGLYYIHHVQEVDHEYENLSEKYEEKDLQLIEGVVGEETRAAYKTYQGFHTSEEIADKQRIIDGSDYQNIYLQYDRDRLNIEFDANGADSGYIKPIEIVHGINQKLPKNTFVKDGYVFDGWTTGPEDGIYFADEDNVKFLQFTVNGAKHGDTVTLYANWVKNKESVNEVEGTIARPKVGQTSNDVKVTIPTDAKYEVKGGLAMAWAKGDTYDKATPLTGGFAADETYWASIKVDLKDKENYKFGDIIDFSKFLGADAIENVKVSKDSSYLEIVCRFDLTGYDVPGIEKIKTINLSLNYPIPGNRQDEIIINIADDKPYRVVDNKFNLWLKGDVLNTAVSTTENFAGGNTYWGIFKLELKDLGAYIFDEKVSVFVGGADEVTEAYVVNNGKNVNITLKFNLDKPHVHNYTKVSGKAPTCTEAGYHDYYVCDCGLYFEADGALNPIPDLDAWKKGNGKLDPLGHDVVKVPEVKPTETAAGSKEYYHCNRCGKNYKDKELTEEIMDLNAYLPIPPINPEKPNPEKPNPQPETPETDDVPTTNDSSNISLYASVSLLSLVTVVALIEEKKRYMHH